MAEAGLGLAPGEAFAPEAAGWLRWCFASKDLARLGQGVERRGRGSAFVLQAAPHLLGASSHESRQVNAPPTLAPPRGLDGVVRPRVALPRRLQGSPPDEHQGGLLIHLAGLGGAGALARLREGFLPLPQPPQGSSE